MANRKSKELFKRQGEIAYLNRVPTVPEFSLLCNIKTNVFKIVIAVPFEDMVEGNVGDFDNYVANAVIPPEDDGATMLGRPRTYQLAGTVPPRGKFPGAVLVRVTGDASETLAYFAKLEKKADEKKRRKS